MRATKNDTTCLTPQQLADAELLAHQQNLRFVTALLEEKIAHLKGKAADRALERLRYEGELELHRRIAELEAGDE
jgi:hypothetical protein